MTDDSLADQINDIVSRFCEPKQAGLLGSFYPSLDTSKPNMHDSKDEFLAEKQAVLSAYDNSSLLLRFLALQFADQEELHGMGVSVCDAIDRGAKRKNRTTKVEYPIDLVGKMAKEVGITYSISYLLMSLKSELELRKQELEDQEMEFWSGKSRPPNHYARTIALRLARLVARETAAPPTIGASREGNFPSTEYGRAVEDLFAVLGIKANFRRAGQWAIKQLKPEDYGPIIQPRSVLPALGFPPQAQKNNVIDEIVRALTEGPKK